MTVDTPQPQPWVSPAETKENLDWADLALVDLSKWDQPGGKQELAEALKAGSSHDGFWAVINSGISEEEIFETFSYGKHFFDDYSLEQKRAVEVDFASGNYFGYKPIANKALFGTEVRDNLETFNIAKFTQDGRLAQYHANDFIRNHREKLEQISRKAFTVVDKLLRLFAIILELEEDYFVSRHLYDDPSDDSLRYIKYTPRTAEEDAKVENIWSRAHTDFGTLTLLFNQVVAGLQIKLSNGDWKYVKPVPGGIICNVGDTLNFWSGGFFKTTIHRVVRPPEDQINAPRIGAFYFVRPGDNAEIEIAPSPVLKRLGLYKETKPIGGTEYVRKRVQDYHNREGYEKRNDAIFKVGEFEIPDGFD